MSFLPIERVRGEHLVDRQKVAAMSAAQSMISPDKIIARADGPVEAVTWHMLDGRAVAELTTAKGVRLFDAATGAELPPIDAKLATRIADAAWKSGEKPKSTASLVTEASPEYRAALPAWRIAFADPDDTRVRG